MKKKSKKLEFVLLPICVIAFVIGILNRHNNSNSASLILFLISGWSVGLFYGLHNHEIWYVRRKLNIYERTHNIWVHLIGGTLAAHAAYILSGELDFNNLNFNLSHFSWPELILFILLALGYSGYIPRTLWFLANKGGVNN
ncbi:MAG TPA: hypothetical protein VLE44_02900 [Candidatus Saccharimonadales bacterium]|nr:hypothetical protein [Candidatus Saccharimonadales bacterium]